MTLLAHCADLVMCAVCTARVRHEVASLQAAAAGPSCACKTLKPYRKTLSLLCELSVWLSVPHLAHGANLVTSAVCAARKPSILQ